MGKVKKTYVEVDAHFTADGMPEPEAIVFTGPDGDRRFAIERYAVKPGYNPQIGVAGLEFTVQIPVGRGRLRETKLYCEPVPEDRVRLRWCVAERVG